MKRYLMIFLTICVISFGGWWVVFKLGFNNLAVQSEDTVPALFIPLAVINDHTLYLDKYYEMMLARYPHPDDKDQTKGLTPFYLRKVGNHYLSAFPIITPLLALPLYVTAIALHINFDWTNLAILSHLTGAIIISLASVLLYYMLQALLNLPTKKAMLLTFVYALCTVNLALVSQAMWQHGTVQLLMIAGLIFYFKFFDTKNFTFLYTFSFCFTLAFLSRPTAILPYGLLVLYVLLNHKNKFQNIMWLTLGALVPTLFFLWYNNTFYQVLANQGYSNQLTRNWLGDFPLSFVGVWLSPSKGILTYSPVLIFSLIGLLRAIKTKPLHYRIYVLSALIVLVHTLIISFWKHWFGGWSFGYRMTTDVLPFFILLMVPWISEELPKYFPLFIGLFALSVIVQLFGLVFFDGIWHAAYDRGYQHTGWLWSITDSELMFNFRRVLVKLGLLEKACPTC
jgi:hypothetical protein